jgi:hypothetical protein
MWSTLLQPTVDQTLKLPYHVEYIAATTFRPVTKTTLIMGSTMLPPTVGRRLKLPYHAEYSAATNCRPETKTTLSCGVQCCNQLQAKTDHTIRSLIQQCLRKRCYLSNKLQCVTSQKKVTFTISDSST